ncbi:two component system sensor kinase PhoR [Streptomyces bingchenggensis BCW-1]|uniref:histidine kinase n=1 Tax=Streptomyces bingchenggensis (strain BCW-1) TaxID=749414 RepID=D7C4E3_STRBB|nr:MULTISPECIES: ATP-binding protein [Streptomyces]ADI03965.1 two component system sensor kinase PhoR [Streptomyces bingchenggensis BCW-1]
MIRRTRLRAGRPGSLRSRLVWGAALLAAVAVLAAQTIGFLVLRSWLLNRVDQQLDDFVLPQQAFARDAYPDQVPPPRNPGSVNLPSDFRLTFFDAAGHKRGILGGGKAPGPDLPDSVGRLQPADGRPATVPAVSGDGHWRIEKKAAPDHTSYVVALPLDTFDGATSKLLWLNAIVLAATLTGLIALSRWVVRIGLLPLTRMERSAQDITVSDLSLRLPDTDPRTETGRLGTVLNTMLDRLEQALRERESSEARLRRFVADAGHELRTPLTSIQGFAELALRHEGRSSAERREADRLIVQNAERISLLVDDLLLLAKLDKEPDYRSERVDLLSVAADSVSAAAHQSHGHPIRLGALGAGTVAGKDEDEEELELAETTGDPHRLRQVVGNLLSNALTHTPPGTRVDVRVGTGRAGPTSGGTDRPGRTSPSPPLRAGARICVLEVADQGPGLSPEAAERVFERFYRVDPSRSHDHGGSGLGLAIASAIAQGHGGRLELETAMGRGSVFRLVLPADSGTP